MACALEQDMEHLSVADSLRSQPALLPQRPSCGQQGRRYNLKTNLFKVRIEPSKVGLVYHYDVEITRIATAVAGDAFQPGPDLERDSKRYKKLRLANNLLVFEEMVKNYSNPGDFFFLNDTNRPTIPVFDGVKNMYSAHKLRETQKVFTINIDIDGQPLRYSAKVKLVGGIDMHKLGRFRASDQEPIPEPQDCLQALDIVARHGPHMEMVPVGKSLYRRADQDTTREDIRNAQQIAYGLYLSIQLVKASEVLVVDRSVTLLHKQCTIEQCLTECLGQRGISNFNTLVHGAARVLKGLEVRVNHLTYKRKYKVKDVSDRKPNELMIKITGDGPEREVSVAQYFLEKYNRQVSPNLPCLVVGSSSRPNYLPMDVCSLVADQPVVRVSGEATQQLIRVSARKKPQERSNELVQHCENFCEMSRTYREEFGIQVSKKPMVVEARKLDPPAITYANVQLRPVDGKWDMRGKKFLRTEALSAGEWIILCFDRNVRKDTAIELRNRLSNKAAHLGLGLESRTIIGGRTVETKVLPANYIPGQVEALFMEKFAAQKQEGHGLKMIVCILPENQKLYEEIKLVGDCKLFIVTQGIHSKNCNDKKMNDQYIHNLLLKINHKLGGINHRLNVDASPLPEILQKNKVMVIGVDFTHPSAAELSKTITTSICACVGSVDRAMTKWESSVRVCAGNAQQEMITEIGSMFKHLYKAYANENDCFPEKVIVYRDGISDAQFRNVKKIELESIKTSFIELIRTDEFKHLDDSFAPEVVFIIVQKRHRTRFFPENPNEGTGPVLNVAPGTVVDTDVVSLQKYDYYLTSHEGIQGLSRPAHYTIIHDDFCGGVNPDEIQALTNHLSYCFSRCTRSISVPAPLAYANLAAARARHHAISSRGTGFNFSQFCREDKTGAGPGVYFV